jgi:ABC-type lipopolysaccharide export system ATPase subunit
MREILILVLFLWAPAAALGQAQKPAPVEDVRGKDSALLQGQQRAGIAYRQMQQAQYDRKLAEQDNLNAQSAYRTAQQRADELKRQAETAKQALDAAKTKESAARSAYDKEVNAVDQIHRASQPK